MCENLQVENLLIELEEAGANVSLLSTLLPSDWCNNLEKALLAVQHNPFCLKVISPDLQNNRSVVMEAIENYPSEALELVSESMRSDPEIVGRSVALHGRSLNFASDVLKHDSQLVILALRNSSCAFLETARETDRAYFEMVADNREYMMEAVKQDGYAVKFASERLQQDFELCLEVVRKWGSCIELLPESMRNNRELALEAVKQNGVALICLSDALRNDFEIVKHAVEVEGNALEAASLELCDNFDLVMSSVKQNGNALQYASERLQHNVDIVKQAVTTSGFALAYVPEEFQANEEVVMMAVKSDGLALQFASEALQNNFDIVLQAVSNSSLAFDYASESLQERREIVQATENSRIREEDE